MKIALITNWFSSRGAACIEGLIQDGTHEILVVIPRLRYRRRTVLGTLLCLYKDAGLGYVVEVAFKIICAGLKGLIACIMRRLHLPLIWRARTVFEHIMYRKFQTIMPAGKNDIAALNIVKEYAPDVLITAGTNMILNKNWLELSKLESINVHPSLLPAYRGPDPVYWQLKNREPKLGVTIHRLVSSIDAGEILNQASIELPGIIRERRALDLIDNLVPSMLCDTLARIENETLEPLAQNPLHASYYGYRTNESH